MCGRYALALPAAQIRQRMRRENMRVDRMLNEANERARRVHNVAPGYIEPVYRAIVPEEGQEMNDQGERTDDGLLYVMQEMKWGLIPAWTKRNPDYSTMLKTINCRDDSLMQPGGMWTSMKNRKRCIVPIQGFFEWLKSGKQRIPYYTTSPDPERSLLYLAGLWDSVTYEGTEDPVFTYTIVTTNSNAQLKFLHDRMPVILRPGSKEMRTWLDPRITSWNEELASVLQPYTGELRVYRVSQDVNKAGTTGEKLITPLDEVKGGIKGFFSGASKNADVKKEDSVKAGEEQAEGSQKMKAVEEDEETAPEKSEHIAAKRKRSDEPEDPSSHAPKQVKLELTDSHALKIEGKETPPIKPNVVTSPQKKVRDATKNEGVQVKSKGKKDAAKGTPKITSFFANPK